MQNTAQYTEEVIDNQFSIDYHYLLQSSESEQFSQDEIKYMRMSEAIDRAKMVEEFEALRGELSEY
jgi:hypothetical protein